MLARKLLPLLEGHLAARILTLQFLGNLSSRSVSDSR